MIFYLLIGIQSAIFGAILSYADMSLSKGDWRAWALVLLNAALLLAIRYAGRMEASS